MTSCSYPPGGHPQASSRGHLSGKRSARGSPNPPAQFAPHDLVSTEGRKTPCTPARTPTPSGHDRPRLHTPQLRSRGRSRTVPCPKELPLFLPGSSTLTQEGQVPPAPRSPDGTSSVRPASWPPHLPLYASSRRGCYPAHRGVPAPFHVEHWPETPEFPPPEAPRATGPHPRRGMTSRPSHRRVP